MSFLPLCSVLVYHGCSNANIDPWWMTKYLPYHQATLALSAASLQRGKIPPPTSVLDMTLNNLMVKFQLWGMRSTPLLQLLPGSLWPGVVAPDRVLSMGQIEWFDISTLYKQTTYAKLTCLKKNCLTIQLWANKCPMSNWIVGDR